MNNKKKSYPNAGAQTQQAWIDMEKYDKAPDDFFMTIKTVSLVLGINRNKVRQIPVRRHMIDKLGYYRKGDIQEWRAHDESQQDSLLRKLQAEQAAAVAKIAKQPSRRYVGGPMNKDDAKQAREKTKVNMGKVLSPDEVAWRHPWFSEQCDDMPLESE
jgi:hypothetical protein